MHLKGIFEYNLIEAKVKAEYFYDNKAQFIFLFTLINDESISCN